MSQVDNKIPKLYRRPIPQVAWYLQIKDAIVRSNRTIDKMSINDIATMYRDGNLLCDTCGKSLENGFFDLTLKEHVIHVINPSFVWSCEDCIDDDRRNGRIIAQTDEKWS